MHGTAVIEEFADVAGKLGKSVRITRSRTEVDVAAI